MSAVSTELIRKVRASTGAGMKDVKDALVAVDGDEAAAVRSLREKGLASAAKRSTRSAAAGAVASARDGSRVSLVELRCETDFVAKGADFVSLADALAALAAEEGLGGVEALLGADLGSVPVTTALSEAGARLGENVQLGNVAVLSGHVYEYLHRPSRDLPPLLGVLVSLSGEDEEVGRSVAQHVSFSDPSYLDRSQVPAGVVDNETQVATARAHAEGKPEAVVPRIVSGRLEAFYKEVCLLEQPWIRDPSRTIAALTSDAGVDVLGFARFGIRQ